MKIAVLGTGEVGRALAGGYAGHGHEVVVGTRDVDRQDLRAFAAAAGVALASSADAIADADLVVLAWLGAVTVAALAEVGAERFDGKVVVDATNPLEFVDGEPRLFVSGDDSLGERVQRAIPAARVVKAYNSVGNGLMVDPRLPEGPPTMFVAGNHPEAKAVVTALLAETGWDSEDLGGIEASRLLESLCLAWVAIGRRTGSWGHAFKVLRP